MFERFSDQARRVVVLAQEEARNLNHDYIGTEHILLGILLQGECTAAGVLHGLDITLDALGAEIKELTGIGTESPPGPIPFTPAAKKVLEFSLRESRSLGSAYIGSEHILLGLIREGDGIGAQVLTNRGLTIERVRNEVAQLLGFTVGEPRFSGEFISSGKVRVGRDPLLDVNLQLRAIGRRLAAIEAKLGVEESPAAEHIRHLEKTVATVRMEAESAIDERDFQRAVRLREKEKELLRTLGEAREAWLAEGEPPAAPPAESGEATTAL